jgi:hypothetical protein
MIQLFIYVILAKTHINHAFKRFYGYVNILNQITLKGGGFTFMGTYGNEIIPLVVPLYPHAPKPNLKSK